MEGKASIWEKQEALHIWYEQEYKPKHPESEFLTGETLTEKWGYDAWEDASQEVKASRETFAYEENMFTFDLCATLEDQTIPYYHYVTFDMTEVGYDSLRCFIERVPKMWNADFYEVYEEDPYRKVIFLFFRTSGSLNRLKAASLLRDLPGVTNPGPFEWNRLCDPGYKAED